MRVVCGDYRDSLRRLSLHGHLARQRANFQAQWMAQPGRMGAVYPNWDAYQWIPWR